jgi:hypothetical protein
LNGAAQSDVEAAARSNLISPDSAKIPAIRATKKGDFFLRREAASKFHDSPRIPGRTQLAVNIR